MSDYLGAPGLYGMSYGFASYGMPQTYTVFSAYPGPSYGSNYPPYGILPGRFGVGLWRPGFVAPGYVYGAVLRTIRRTHFPIARSRSVRPTVRRLIDIASPPPVGFTRRPWVRGRFTAGEVWYNHDFGRQHEGLSCRSSGPDWQRRS